MEMEDNKIKNPYKIIEETTDTKDNNLNTNFFTLNPSTKEKKTTLQSNHPTIINHIKRPENNGNTQKKNYNSQTLEYFYLLNSLLISFFSREDISEETYNNSSPLEKLLLKSILIRKFGIKKRTFSFISEDWNSDHPLKFNTIQTLCKITSDKRRNETAIYIIKEFMRQELTRFQRQQICPERSQFADFVYSTKQYFLNLFRCLVNCQEEHELKKIISCFIDLKSPANKEFKKEICPDRYRGNFMLKNMILKINQSEELRRKFWGFLDEKSQHNIFSFCKMTIAKKFGLKVESMEEEFIFKYYKNEERFYYDFKRNVQKPKYKLPMLILDIWKSVNFLRSETNYPKQ